VKNIREEEAYKETRKELGSIPLDRDSYNYWHGWCYAKHRDSKPTYIRDPWWEMGYDDSKGENEINK
jgi:hypothetical protein